MYIYMYMCKYTHVHCTCMSCSYLKRLHTHRKIHVHVPTVRVGLCNVLSGFHHICFSTLQFFMCARPGTTAIVSLENHPVFPYTPTFPVFPCISSAHFPRAHARIRKTGWFTRLSYSTYMYIHVCVLCTLT